MRKLIVSIHSTVNDVVTGPPAGDETDFGQWAQPGIDDTSASFLTSLQGVTTVLLGRGTYQDLVRKWPQVEQWPDVPEVALGMGRIVNTAEKFVVSDSLSADRLPWGKHDPVTRIAGADLNDRVSAWKQGDGGDIITFGSPVLVRALTNARLVDEYQIIVHPVIVGVGRRLFEDLDARTDLRLVDVETFDGGAMMITYATAS